MFNLDERLQQDTVRIGELDLCIVLLMNDSQYPWVILVPKLNDISEIYRLSSEQQATLMLESNQVLELMAGEYNADKMNVAALGNVVSQLHIHHVVRFKKDPAWPAPVWGAVPAKPYNENQLKETTRKLRTLFSRIKSFN